MEVIEVSKNQKELLDIVQTILFLFGIYENKSSFLSLEEAIKKLNSFEVNEVYKDIDHFYYFASKLFLDDSGALDFDIGKLKTLVKTNYIKDIFDSLVNNIKLESFFDFLYELGDIFRKIYFEVEEFQDITDEFRHKSINNYECFFKIFSKCKKYDRNINYISGNYNIYFAEIYLTEIKYNLILSNNTYIKLCISNPTYDDLQEILIEDENTTSDSEDKNNKIIMCENIILKNLQTFWCNSVFLFSEDLDIFMNLFYDFITQKKKKNFILNNIFEDSMKKYLEFLTYDLKKLFMDFDKNSLTNFCQNLYDFVSNNKNKNIKFVDLSLKIGEINNLNNEDIGLISFLCSNNKTIENIENIINTLKKDYTEEDIEELINKNGFSDHEIYIFYYLILEKSKKNDQNTILDQSNEYPGKVKNNENDIINTQIPKITITEKIKMQNISEIPSINEEFSDDPKYKNLLSIIEKLNNNDKNLNEKLNQLNNEIVFLKQELNNEKEKLNKKIEDLNNIHKIIYFRDVSKYYINQFSRKFGVYGEDTFHRSQNILSMDFSKKKLLNYQNVMIKIVTHYLNGNKFAHIEYYITKSKSSNITELAKEIENSYMEFMKFKDDAKKIINNSFNLRRAPFIHLKYPKKK